MISNGNVRPGGSGLVLRVIDGDTIRIWHEIGKVNVRLIGIDAPEREQSFYSESKAFLEGLLASNPKPHVELVFDGPLESSHNRLRAHVYIPNTPQILVSLKLLENGYAKVWRYRSHQYEEMFKEAEEQAKKEKKGIWNNKNLK